MIKLANIVSNIIVKSDICGMAKAILTGKFITFSPHGRKEAESQFCKNSS
jgi:hypothetical protein